MRRLLTLILLVISLTACKKEKTADYEKRADVSYGNDAARKMDIYIPPGAAAGTTKLMVLIHGGSWSSGDKTDFNSYIEIMKERLPGYVFANINYRLFSNGQNKFPAQEEDVDAAIKYLLAQSGTEPWSKDIVLMGASAGAHLALLQGYKHISTNKPKAIVSLFAPVDLVELYNNPAFPLLPPILAEIIGSTPTQNPTAWQESSPINYITAQCSPTIVFHGGQDPLVPHEQADLLVNKLKAAGVTNQFVFYPNQGHGWEGADLDDTINKAIAFLQQQVP